MIKNIYAVKTESELTELQRIVHEMWPELEQFLSFLKEKYRTVDLPRCIVWTDYETATNSISDLPLPAYTNDYRTVMVPDIDVWKKLYLRQLESYEENEKTSKVRTYYEMLTNRNVLQIIGHEMAHHSDLFLDDAYEEAMWFEEGMVEYISRKYFLSEAEFAAEEEADGLLVELYEKENGILSLNDFRSLIFKPSIGSSQVDEEVLQCESTGNPRAAETVSKQGYQNHK